VHGTVIEGWIAGDKGDGVLGDATLVGGVDGERFADDDFRVLLRLVSSGFVGIVRKYLEAGKLDQHTFNVAPETRGSRSYR
jgi:hypothetical protein